MFSNSEFSITTPGERSPVSSGIGGSHRARTITRPTKRLRVVKRRYKYNIHIYDFNGTRTIRTSALSEKRREFGSEINVVYRDCQDRRRRRRRKIVAFGSHLWSGNTRETSRKRKETFGLGKNNPTNDFRTSEKDALSG